MTLLLSRRQALRLGLTAPTGWLAWPALGQRSPQPAPRYDIFESGQTTHAFTRQRVDIAEHPDHRYQLFTAVPKQPPPPGGFPVLCMLDGNSVFDRLTPADLDAARGLVIVGVGYPTEQGFDSQARTRDYTPPPADTPLELPQAPAVAYPDARQGGGAPLFQQLLAGPLRAAAERDMLQGVLLNPERRALWGHSYGGLFALYTLLTRPADFRRYCAISPSTTWGGNLLSQLARQRIPRDIPANKQADAPPGPQAAPPTDVLVMLGDREVRGQGRGVPPPASPAPNPVTLDLIEQLRRQPGLQLQASILQGRGHGATFMASLPRSFELAQA